jgi:hypothetical protein
MFIQKKKLQWIAAQSVTDYYHRGFREPPQGTREPHMQKTYAILILYPGQKLR